MTTLSLTQKRVLSGVAFVQLVFFISNYYFFHFLEPFDQKVLILSCVITGIYVMGFGPTVAELRDAKDKRHRSGK